MSSETEITPPDWGSGTNFKTKWKAQGYEVGRSCPNIVSLRECVYVYFMCVVYMVVCLYVYLCVSARIKAVGLVVKGNWLLPNGLWSEVHYECNLSNFLIHHPHIVIFEYFYCPTRALLMKYLYVYCPT